MHHPCEDTDWKMESLLDSLLGEETLSMHCHSVYKHMLPWLPTPWPSALEPAESLADVQECQLIVDLLLCPSFVPFWICRSVEFSAASRALRGDWCPGLSQWDDRTGKDIDAYACTAWAPAKGGLVFPFSQAVCTEVLNRRMIIAAPDQGGRIRLWTKISALAYLALADKCCDKNIPFNWKKIFVNQDKEIVTAFGQCGRGFIFC